MTLPTMVYGLRLYAETYGIAQLQLAGLEYDDAYWQPLNAIGEWYARGRWCQAIADLLWRRALRAPVRLAGHHARAEAVRRFYAGRS